MMTTEQIFPTMLSIFGCSHLNPLTSTVSPITSVLGGGGGSGGGIDTIQLGGSNPSV
jgi:hypothetical protein